MLAAWRKSRSAVFSSLDVLGLARQEGCGCAIAAFGVDRNLQFLQRLVQVLQRSARETGDGPAVLSVVAFFRYQLAQLPKKIIEARGRPVARRLLLQLVVHGEAFLSEHVARLGRIVHVLRDGACDAGKLVVVRVLGGRLENRTDRIQRLFSDTDCCPDRGRRSISDRSDVPARMRSGLCSRPHIGCART